MTGLELALIVLLGVVLFLDHWPAVQTMASRPIVGGSLVGVVLGAPIEGVLWGAALEAVYLGVLPVGAARYPDVAAAGIVGTAIALAGREAGLYPAGLAVALAIAAGRLGEWVGQGQRRWNGRLAVRVREQVAAGDLRAPGRALALALARCAGLGAAVTGVMLALGLALLHVLGGTPWSGTLPPRAVAASALAIGAVAGARLFVGQRRRAAALGAGVALGAGIAWWGAGP